MLLAEADYFVGGFGSHFSRIAFELSVSFSHPPILIPLATVNPNAHTANPKAYILDPTL